MREQLLFGFEDCSVGKHINIYGGHWQGDDFHFYGNQYVLPMERDHIGTIVLALMKDKVKIKRPGNLWLGKAVGTEERSPKARKPVCTTVEIFGFADLHHQIWRAGNC